MSAKIGTSGKIALEYIELFPKTPLLTLARKMYNENPEVYTDTDHARSMIRYYKGKSGNKQRHYATDKSHFTQKGQEAKELGIPNPYELPESDADDWPPFIIPKGNNKILLLSDIHIPYHDVKAVEMAVEYGKEQGVNTVILNGDIMDCYALSRYEKDPRKRRFSEELEMTREFLGWITNELPAKYYYKIGNHEERYEAFLRIKAPELLDLTEFRLDVLLHFGQFGIDLITDKRVIKAGELNILHGHEFGRSVFSPVNPARGYYMRSKTNIIAGHNHQTSNHMETNLNGKVIGAWSTGCLCELHPQYMPINKWNLGFAVIHVQKDGSFEIDNLSIINGKIR